jgi:putative PIN family toxin of toxin-antitoxin system
VGTQESVSRRVVFDTTIVVSALVFAHGRLAWLRRHWREGGCVPLISTVTVTELTRVLGYPKFNLSASDRRELLSDYLPFCEIIERTRKSDIVCRDDNDQSFLDLALSGKAELLISGDRDLLTLAGKTRFLMETPEAYRVRIFGTQNPTPE